MRSAGSAPERWPRGAYAAMARHLDAGASLVVIAGKALHDGQTRSGEVLPATGWHAKPGTRPHLQYAATWFMIAGTLVIKVR